VLKKRAKPEPQSGIAGEILHSRAIEIALLFAAYMIVSLLEEVTRGAARVGVPAK
jgi:hypothetical protein